MLLVRLECKRVCTEYKEIYSPIVIKINEDSGSLLWLNS